MDYQNEKHRSAFADAIQKLNRKNRPLMAALYLLTADHRLWTAASPFVRPNEIIPNAVRIPDCTENAYTLLCAAKDLYLMKKGNSEMIKIKIRNGDSETDIRFPISENDLYNKLTAIHAIDSTDEKQPVTVTGIYRPEEFSVLEGRQVNLNEINYLAKRMDSFDKLEMDEFLIGITKLDNPSVKDIINLTFNLDHFTLVQDISNYGKIGRQYVLNTEGCVPSHDEDDPKYAIIGKDLIDRGLAQITAKGLLIYNPFDEMDEVYDGQTFPKYAYTSTLASAEVSYNGHTELPFLFPS